MHVYTYMYTHTHIYTDVWMGIYQGVAYMYIYICNRVQHIFYNVHISMYGYILRGVHIDTYI